MISLISFSIMVKLIYNFLLEEGNMDKEAMISAIDLKFEELKKALEGDDFNSDDITSHDASSNSCG